jgi:(p)ppGpp synthase/HD superfamily hydrolase
MRESHAFAQTNAHLYIQLLELGYDEPELARVRDCYELAMSLHSSRFRPSGRPFVCHAVGTASILAWLGASVDVVLTGLLHGAYDQGDFGDGTRGITPTKRATLRESIGGELEERVASFFELEWSAEPVEDPPAFVEGLDELGHDTLLVRLANELDELLDGEIHFRTNAQQRIAEAEATTNGLVGLARQLDEPRLASALADAGADCAGTHFPQLLRNTLGYNFSVAPRSLGRRPAAIASDLLGRVRGHFAGLRDRLWPG